MKCNHKSLENIHCFKCDKTCIELLDEQADRIRELEAEVEKYKMLAEDRKDDTEVLSEAIDDIIKLKDRIKELEAKLNFRYEQEKSGDIKIAEEFRKLKAENQRLQGIITENKERIYRLEKELKEKKSE